ncbi:hypothetical protein [Roseovarius sp. M141]|uniref:hypothetical protein n=1 Tax=Roseovarius sp. M141 TaxID=2583806 RepID=UPI0020CD4FF3|nr:hypothetical protein [Roseovarius sp. M141]MCQ0093950.1 hypothetical protein [Roseovarius sp. M141]
MELLAAMFCGAVGSVALGARPLGRVLATGLGIVAGGSAWYLLTLIGPGLKAGPLVLVHAVAGGAMGAALVAVGGLARRRLGR